MTPQRAAERALHYISSMAEWGCGPTFFTPGRVVQRYPTLLSRLQDAGAEIAVHGFNHFDLGHYTPDDACRQLIHAAETFRRLKLEVHGFRCPYLGCNEPVLDALPKGLFEYSSNKAVWYDVPHVPQQEATAILKALTRFYDRAIVPSAVSVPWTRSNMVELPIALPDDLQLYDGLRLRSPEMAEIWTKVLSQIHANGELFVLQFHPELSWGRETPPTSLVLLAATELRPSVWITRMRDVAPWWSEKGRFEVVASETDCGIRLSFECSDRATILARGLPQLPGTSEWDGAYRRVVGRSVDLPPDVRPFVGLPKNTPPRVKTFLSEQGYLVDDTERAPESSVWLDQATLDGVAGSDRRLLDHIESSTTPLVRYGRWPDGHKSALCITGDLDAMTLVDYAVRLFPGRD